MSHYSQIFSKLNHSVHSVFSKLQNICLPLNLSQRHVLLVLYDLIIKSVKWLKSKSYDIDGISVKNIKPDCTELMFHLLLLFEMCLVSSIVPESFTVSKILNTFYFGHSMKAHFMEKISLGSSKE